jgi:hypothetical protein
MQCDKQTYTSCQHMVSKGNHQGIYYSISLAVVLFPSSFSQSSVL